MAIVFLAVVWMAIALSIAKDSKKVCNLTLEGDPATTAEDVFCPPWFVQEPNSTQCKCGSAVGGLIECQYSPPYYYYVSLPVCYCMTAHIDCNSSTTILGSCPYSCVGNVPWSSDPQKLNAITCEEKWNRAGPLCARCQEGFGPPVYSYDLSCIPCNATNITAVVKFAAISFIPLTLFCLGIIVFRISATKPPLDILIFVSQILAAPQYMQIVQPKVLDESDFLPKPVHDMCWKLFAAFFGVWNLDFFRSFYPSLCFSSHMTSLQATFLEYTIGLYPLLMIAVIYVIVQLYDRCCTTMRHNCRLYCCTPILRRFEIRSALIDAFATFLILAYVKIGYTSVSILEPTVVHTPDGAYKLYAYADASMEYMGTEHRKYALPAIFITVIFTVLPLLYLVLFPLTCFQRGLNFCGCRCLTLRIFADAFQGCYKDGTEGTRDNRWFSGLQLSMRLAIVVIFEIERHHSTMIILAMILVIVYLAMIETMQPYKRHRNIYIYFKINAPSVLLLSLSLWIIGKIIADIQRDTMKIRFAMHSSLLILSSLIPFCYAVGLFFYWLFAVKQCGRKGIAVLLKCIKKQGNEEQQLLQNSS